MNLKQRKAAFIQLGKVFSALSQSTPWPGFALGLDEEEYQKFEATIASASHNNGWFTPANVRRALAAWAQSLTPENVDRWLTDYPLSDDIHKPKKVGLVLAGNIPMVGFHDIVSTLISGHHAVVKLSSSDAHLIPEAVRTLLKFEPSFAQQITFVERLENIEAVIATGSNNSSRYFEHYFSRYPHIIRKNRNSLAVIGENVSDEQLTALGDDIFAYFGMGCRNVTKLMIPKSFNIDRFFEAIYPYREIVEHNKYANNYDYHKALYLLNQEDLLDNGFLLLRKHPQLQSPLGTLHYERYESNREVEQFITEHQPEIQCVISAGANVAEALLPGQSQQPQLWDYADGVDTLRFLTQL